MASLRTCVECVCVCVCARSVCVRVRVRVRVQCTTMAGQGCVFRTSSRMLPCRAQRISSCFCPFLRPVRAQGIHRGESIVRSIAHKYRSGVFMALEYTCVHAAVWNCAPCQCRIERAARTSRRDSRGTRCVVCGCLGWCHGDEWGWGHVHTQQAMHSSARARPVVLSCKKRTQLATALPNARKSMATGPRARTARHDAHTLRFLPIW
jgi:hypothetical protein